MMQQPDPGDDHTTNGITPAAAADIERQQLLAHSHPDAAAAADDDSCAAAGDSSSRSSLTAAAAATAKAAAHTKALLCLCGAHALARWGWRTWEFAVALILIRLFPSSLLLVSVFGLLDNMVRLLCGSVIGQFVDRTERLRGAVTCYGIQNVCIAVSAAAAAALVLLNSSDHGQLQETRPVLYWCLTSVTLLAGASSSIGSLGAAVAVEREYAKTLCGPDSAALRKLNSGLRAIDLLSQMLGPVVSGLIMSHSSMLTAIVVLSAYSLAAWLPEGWCLQAAHRYAPQLRQPKPPVSSSAAAASRKPNAFEILLNTAGWASYFQQGPTLLPGLALALLYLTVLSLGFLMTSFLAWFGLSEATISLFRSAGALSGLLATLVFHPLQRCGVGLVGAGVLGISWQLVFLLAGVVPVVLARVLPLTTPGHSFHQALTSAIDSTTALHSLETINNVSSSSSSVIAAPAPSSLAGLVTNSTTTTTTAAIVASAAAVVPSGALLPPHLLYVLLTGLVASRFGLWLFDLAVSQLQQELVPDAQLGTVSGVQASLQSAFEILSFVAGAAVNRPQHFHGLMAGSVVAVATAAALYYLFACASSGSGPAAAGVCARLQHAYANWRARRERRPQPLHRHQSDVPLQQF